MVGDKNEEKLWLMVDIEKQAMLLYLDINHQTITRLLDSGYFQRVGSPRTKATRPSTACGKGHWGAARPVTLLKVNASSSGV
jgi:hypothetical protein